MDLRKTSLCWANPVRLNALLALWLLLMGVTVTGWSCSRGRDADGPGKHAVHEITIEASRPIDVTPPFDIVPIGENGELGLWLQPDLAQDDSAGEGKAEYRFYVPETDRYALWAYCLWRGEGRNTIAVSIDGRSVGQLGGDGESGEWRWTAASTSRLSEGMHTLTVTAVSGNVAMRKMFLANTDMHPKARGVVVSELFHDDFNGCNDGNFGLWEQYSGEWRVVRPEGEHSPAKRVLSGLSWERAMLCLPGEEWGNYVLSVRCRSISGTGPKAMFGICFGMVGLTDYYMLYWTESPEEDRAAMRLVRREGDQTQVIDSFYVPWTSQQWHDVEITLGSDRIQVSIDNGKTREIRCESQAVGGIGLWLGGPTEAEFDDILVRGSALPPHGDGP